MQIISLNGHWTMALKGEGRFYDAQVPTTMYQVLMENGAIDDPFYGENDQIYRDLSKNDCIFTKVFDVNDEFLGNSDIELEFLGLDTLATITLNGHVVDVTNNMHRTYRYPIGDLLSAGTNHLVVILASPMNYIAKEQGKDPLWGVSSTIPGYGHLRKAHHMFGWDWGPQLPDMGIWRDVTLFAYNAGKVESVQVIQHHESEGVVLDIVTDLSYVKDGLDLTYELLDREGQRAAFAVSHEVDEKEGVSLELKNPNLWWPNGYGDQYLYTLKVTLTEDGQPVDQDIKMIGLRTMTIHKEKDQWGETFEFQVNGLRIFAMGADYIPEDTLIARPTPETTERLIKDCARANYNCLRVWGGAYYPNDTFFDLCDRYGLIVWQDFMFACGVYRLTKKFEANITAEFIDNIKRIRHHACLGLWCGNNEMEWAFVEWPLPKDERLKMDYLLMYEKLIPDVLAEYDPQTFYWPASPSSGGGFNEPNDDSKGDVHYWQVFHGNEHYKKFREHHFRFASEYGMQAFPDMKTIDAFLPKDQYNLFSSVMENHNKCIEPLNGNVKVVSNMVQEFLLPNSFEDQVYISQVFQGETIRCAVEHFRRNRGRCMGSTYWQVNDNYPVTSWASIDVYGRWKAMHYMARRFYAPVLISAYEEGTTGHIHVTNDRPETFEGRVQWQLRHTEEGILEEGTVDLMVSELCAVHVLDVSIEDQIENYGDERKLYLTFQLYEDDVRIASESLLFVCHKNFHFKSVNLEVRVVEAEENLVLELHSDGYAKSVGIQTRTYDLLFEDNYFDMLPGETKTLRIEEIRCEKALTKDLLAKDIVIKAVNTMNY